jgi:hypothetical protein
LIFEVRLCYPTNDTPIFTLPGVDVNYFYCTIRTPAQKSRNAFVAGAMVVAWMAFWCLFGLFAAHLYDASWTALLRLNPVLLVFILAPTAFPIYWAIGYASPHPRPHYFFKEWARVYGGRGRNPYTPFFAEWIESFHFKKASLMGNAVCLVTARFKPMEPRILGRRDDLEFVICKETQTSLANFEEWARRHGIKIIE